MAKIHPDMLETAAYLSLAAYEEKIEGLAIHGGWTSAKAVITRHADYDALTYCGTKDRGDIAIDLTAIPFPYMGAWAHLGFYLQLQSVWPEIQDNLTPDRPLLVDGHSLGGGLAELTIPLVRHFKSVYLITFGKPNVWLKRSAPLFPWLKAQVSVVSGSDIVTRSPRILYGPSVGQDILYFDNTGGVVWNPTAEFRRQDYRLFDIIEDHSAIMYLKKTRDFCR